MINQNLSSLFIWLLGATITLYAYSQDVMSPTQCIATGLFVLMLGLLVKKVRKMSHAMRGAVINHHDIHALWSYGRGIERIHCPSQNNKSIVSNLSAKDNLWITWGSDARYWEWTTEEIGGECVDAAKLIDVCWLELGGKYALNTELTEGMTYEVKLVVKVMDDCNIDDPVSFSITTPDGCKHEHEKNMMEMPRNQIIGITFGEFQARQSYGHAEVEFSMKCTDGGSWKRGMVVIGALVVPKF